MNAVDWQRLTWVQICDVAGAEHWVAESGWGPVWSWCIATTTSIAESGQSELASPDAAQAACQRAVCDAYQRVGQVFDR